MNSSFELEKKSNKKLTSNVLYCKVLKSFLNFIKFSFIRNPPNKIFK